MQCTKGEVRQVGIEITNQVVGQNFVIDNADYEITDVNGVVLETGYATIDGHKIVTLFSARDIGVFFCIFTYRIASEILKAKVQIKVR